VGREEDARVATEGASTALDEVRLGRKSEGLERGFVKGNRRIKKRDRRHRERRGDCTIAKDPLVGPFGRRIFTAWREDKGTSQTPAMSKARMGIERKGTNEIFEFQSIKKL